MSRPSLCRPTLRALACVATAVCTALLPAAPAGAAAPAAAFVNCTALHAVYPHGVGLRAAVDKTSSTPVTTFRRDDTEFKRAVAARPGLDRDHDSIACEKR